MPCYALVKNLFCPSYEGDVGDVSDNTVMLNIHFDWIMILQGFLNVILKTCYILGNHILW